MENRKMITKKESMIILFIIIVSFLSIIIFNIVRPGGKKVIISIDGTRIDEVSLSIDKTYKYNTGNGYNVIEIKDMKVKVIESDCKNHNCVNHKGISKVGDTIICLPHKLVVEIID